MSEKPKKPIIDLKSPVLGVWAEDEFLQLTEQEKNYAYYISKASWEGSMINYFQKSYESPALFIILQLTFSGQTLDILMNKVGNEENFQKFLIYSAAVFNNCGNFKSFGDTKFVPDLTPEEFFQVVSSSANYSQFKDLLNFLFSQIKTELFSYEGRYEKIGLPPVEGCSGYYSGNLTKEEIDIVDSYLQTLQLSFLNTRVIKLADKHFQVLVASVSMSQKSYFFQGNRIDIVYGDYSSFLKRVVKNLQQCLSYAANCNQRQMLQKYIQHFQTGDIDLHKDSQRAWVRDQNPVIETNFGFVESYLDPKGMRAEWEGFAACVNKKQSKVTQYFVSRAEEFLEMMPWPRQFEKDKFLRPDFTSLSVISFAGSGTPLGINIPNYDDIRQEEGFKNVYLGNCVPYPKVESILFLDRADAEHKIKFFPQVIFHKVVFHELLGHGCGKLFQKTEQGLNFESSTTINPLTNQPVNTYYKETDTYLSLFQNLSQPYEECRADSVALYFSTFEKSYEVLQPEYQANWLEICQATFLEFIYQGIIGLQFYNVAAKKWGQAHINGRWVIFQVLLEAGNGFVEIDRIADPDNEGKFKLKVKFDRSQVLTTGKEALRKFLLHQQVYKSTADIQSARQFFERYSEVNEKFLQIREVVMDNIKPRRLEVQGYLEKGDNGQINYTKFPETVEGLITSYLKWFPYLDKEVLDLWEEHYKIMKTSN